MENKILNYITSNLTKDTSKIYKKIEINNQILYFIYEISIFYRKDKIFSSEINPLALILNKKSEYYFYSLNEKLTNYREIIEEFLEKEYSHLKQ
jgi:hypothetical protein